MLDTIRTLVAETLAISTAEVNEARDALLKEQGTADARYAATSALIHPEGSTTPINEACWRAQNRIANLRSKAAKELPKAMSLLLSLEVATQLAEETRQARDMKMDETYVKDMVGVKEEVRDWWRRLVKHGVHPHHVRQHSAETVAIIADLVTWKAKDATFKDPDNPWRALLTIYANRSIEKPGKSGKAKRSVSGTPKRPKNRGDVGDYLFDEIVSAEWGSGFSSSYALADEAGCAGEVAPSGVEGVLSEAVEGTDAAADPSPIVHADRHETLQPDEVPQQPDLYALPNTIASDAASRLREIAERMIEDEYDEWKLELQQALRFTNELSAEEAVARVEAARPPSYTTPFSYFLDAARAHGVVAGWSAYEEATLRRFMLEIATSPYFAETRRRLGLE